MRIFIFLFLTSAFLAFIPEARAVQTAIVGVDKAVVYADQEMTSAIGFVRGGRQLKVGSKPRRGGAILPIIVAGKVAYIRTQDVSISNNPLSLSRSPEGPKIREYEIDIPMGEVKDDLKENNHIVIGLGQLSDNSDLSAFNEQSGFEDKSITSLKAMFEHRPVIYDFFWDIGFGYYTLSQDSYTFRTLTFEGHVYYSFLKHNKFHLQVFGGLAISGEFRVTAEQEAFEEAGAMWGHHFGVAAKIFPRDKFSFNLSAGLQTMNPIDIEGFEQIRGPHLSAGIAYKF